MKILISINLSELDRIKFRKNFYKKQTNKQDSIVLFFEDDIRSFFEYLTTEMFLKELTLI